MEKLNDHFRWILVVRWKIETERSFWEKLKLLGSVFFYSWVNPEPEVAPAIIASERALVSISGMRRTLVLSLSRITTTKRSPRYLTLPTSAQTRNESFYLPHKTTFLGITGPKRAARKRDKNYIHYFLKIANEFKRTFFSENEFCELFVTC